MNVSEYRDDDSQGLATSSEAPAKFTQICASQNDLFALDKHGNIYQYDFNAKTWGKLVSRAARWTLASQPETAERGRLHA